MMLTNVVEIIHSGATRLTLYHEECYLPLAVRSDILIRLLSVSRDWIDPGCAFCHKALATHQEREVTV